MQRGKVSNELLKLSKNTLSYFSTWDRNVSSLVHNSQSDFEIVASKLALLSNFRHMFSDNDHM